MTINVRWFDRFISWARYLYWSELNRQRLDQFTEKADMSKPDDSWKWWAFMSQWYGSLWVVVEGWKTLMVKDQKIDYLLSNWPQYSLLLKRFRHGVYHCRPTLLDKKSLEFVRQGRAAVYWATALHEEFQRFYWEWPNKVMVTDEQAEDLKRDLHKMIGWLPSDIMPARKRDLEAFCNEAENILREAGDSSSALAIDVLEAVKEARAIIEQSPNEIFLPEIKKQKEKSLGNDP